MNTPSPLVTVIVPIYNVAPYLEQCIRSVLEQTYPDFELILVDDGSTDHSGQIVDRMAKQDSRIRPVHQKNQGVAAARNTGLELARGVYTAFLDGDDWYHRDHLLHMVAAMQNTSCQLVSCCFEPVGAEHPPQVKKLNAATVGRCEAMQFLMGYNSFNGYVWNKLFSMQLIRQHHICFRSGYPACEDTMFVGSYLYYCDAIRVTEEVLYYYRQISSGANRGRYSGRTVYDPRLMSVFEMTAALADLYDDASVRAACQIHEVREAGIVLRSMVSAGYHGADYTRLRHILHRGAGQFFRDPNSGCSQKLSVLLSCISPKLELAVWKLVNQNKPK